MAEEANLEDAREGRCGRREKAIVSGEVDVGIGVNGRETGKLDRGGIATWLSESSKVEMMESYGGFLAFWIGIFSTSVGADAADVRLFAFAGYYPFCSRSFRLV